MHESARLNSANGFTHTLIIISIISNHSELATNLLKKTVRQIQLERKLSVTTTASENARVSLPGLYHAVHIGREYIGRGKWSCFHQKIMREQRDTWHTTQRC